MIRKISVSTIVAVFVFSVACTHRVQVEPIHITVDVNIKVDRALDDFFSDIDETGTAVETTPISE